MMTPPCKVAWIVHSPTPYKTPFFRALAARPEVAMNYFFLFWDDPQRPWAQDADQGFNYKVLPGFSIRKRLKERAYVHCGPGIILDLIRGRFAMVVICGYDHPTLVFALVYCLLTGTPFVLQGESHVVHKRGSFKRLLKRWLLFPVLRFARAAFATGRMAREYWVSVGIPREKTFIVANTPDINFFLEASRKAQGRRAAVRKELGLDERPTGIFVGRFVNVKGIDVVLEALARLAPRERPQLLLVGDGPLRPSFEEFITRHDLPVHLLGFLQKEQLPELYAASDFFILPSRSEPWGVVVNEAMACGLPVLLSDQVGAAYDLLNEGENGYMIATGDVEAWTKGLRKIGALEPAALQRMGARSRDIIKPWNHETSVENVLACVRLVCGVAGSPQEVLK